jgi:type IV secretory pathway VirJ component
LLIAGEEQVRFGRFGMIHLYHKAPKPSRVVLFVSGDGGWNQGVVDMARELTGLDALVAGIDIRSYLKALEASTEKCSYPAEDFEGLSKFIQKRSDYSRYVTPLLVGYSSGATLVYAVLAQAPSTTFRGAISMGFCPDLPLIRPMCRGSGLEWARGPKGKGFSFLPAKNLEVPWIVLQGSIDQLCDPKSTEAFVQQIRNGKLVLLPKVGHGFSVPRNWLPQFLEAARPLTDPPLERYEAGGGDTLAELPLVEVPVKQGSADAFAVVISGDGGWAVTDRGLAESLAARGIPTVGVNSLQYFWHPKTPEKAAADLERILVHYQRKWQKERVILIGYSFGADVLPFMVNLLPVAAKSRIKVVAFIGLGSMADFEFHLVDWLGSFRHTSSRPVKPEVERLGLKLYCFYGTEDADTLCPNLPASVATCVPMDGGHRIGKNFSSIVDKLLGGQK